MDSETELKARVMTEDQKIAFLSRVEERPGFQGVGIIFDKKKMSKKITSESVFYNYSVTCLFEEVIFPMFDIGQDDDPVTHIRFELVCDNRPISVEEKKSLENHLNAVFLYHNCTFEVSYVNSATDFRIQLADLIVNTLFLSKHNRSVINRLLNEINPQRYLFSLFPEKIQCGGSKKMW